VAGLWFSPLSITNETDRHDIVEILLKVALNTITLTHKNMSTMGLIFGLLAFLVRLSLHSSIDMPLFK
jgi:hypothetical protein